MAGESRLARTHFSHLGWGGGSDDALGTPVPTGSAARTRSPAEPISIHGAGGSASSEKGAHHWGQRGSAGGRRGATGTLVRPRSEVVMASPQLPHSESSRQEEPPWGGSMRLGERRRSVNRGEESPVRNLRRPRPLTLPLPLHDCGAAADLPRGRPRKPAGVSSAARTRPTSKPRLSAP